VAQGDSIPFDYRKSHVSPDKGSRYDALYAPGSALAFYWGEFERPYIEAQFARVQQERGGGRYLDFACGTGRILSVGAPFFDETVGIDVSEAMTTIAREKTPEAQIVQADVLTQQVDVGTFDVVTLFRFLLRAGVLRDDVLQWLRGVIRPDGILIVNNHRNAHSVRGVTYRIGHTIHPDGFENELLTDREVEAMLRRHGFDVVEEYGFGSVPSFRGRLLLPRRLLLALERRLSGSGRLTRFAKNRIYVCRPVSPETDQTPA
jgi:SAM-dependent methyltransferase